MINDLYKLFILTILVLFLVSKIGVYQLLVLFGIGLVIFSLRIVWLVWNQRKRELKEKKLEHFLIERDIKLAGTKYYANNIKEINYHQEKSNVFLIREPDNPYDRNAIQVCDEKGKKLGYIPKDLAWHLAYFMDHDKETKIQTKIKKIYLIDEIVIVILHLTISASKIFSYWSEDWDWKQKWKMLSETMKNQLFYPIEEIERNIQNYEVGIEKLKSGALHEAIELFKKIDPLSFLYEKAQIRIKEIENKIKEDQIIKEKKQAEQDFQNYEWGLKELNNKNYRESLNFFKKISSSFPDYLDVKTKIQEIEEILDPEKNKLNYKRGLEEFNKKNWEEVINLMLKIPPQSPLYKDAQQRVEESHRKIKKWENIIKEVETLNLEARKINREIKFAFSSIEDGAGSGLIEKTEKLENLKSKILELLKKAEKIYPIKTKEFYRTALRKKRQREKNEKIIGIYVY